MIQVGLFIKDSYTDEFHRVELFTDEKISLTSSIQNVNDISKVFSDFSRTFSVPASVKNNQIFHHWYDPSNTVSFTTKIKIEAFIEIDTILFRNGKIQLEGCNLMDERPQSYSLTFIGSLGSLKDKFNGLYLKDLTLNTAYDNFNYTPNNVIQKVTSLTPTSPATPDILFPLISSSRLWNYNQGGNDDITQNNHPIRYNELFPALRLRAVFDMIQTEFGITLNGNFINSDDRFLGAFLYMKNADDFTLIKNAQKLNFTTKASTNETGFNMDLTTDKLSIGAIPSTIVVSGTTYFFNTRYCQVGIATVNAGVEYVLAIYKNGMPFQQRAPVISTAGGTSSFNALSFDTYTASTDYYEFYVFTAAPLTFTCFASGLNNKADYISSGGFLIQKFNSFSGTSQSTATYYLPIKSYFPNIKIEDFFAGVLKMFNLTCYSEDGINYTIDTIDNYYSSVIDIDITNYVLQDNRDLSRVQNYKKINFKYQPSDSLINVAFKSVNGIDYGNLYYSDNSDGAEYNIELPFEDLNFSNLNGLLQVGYCLKTDYQKYIPKPIILYDYNPSALTNSGSTFHMSNALTGNGTAYTNYRAFGQETLISGVTHSLNFPEQQSTLTNQVVENGLYKNYYQNYFANIFNYKARLYKCKAILPTSILTTLKLNNNVIIRDEKFLINNMVTDLTTGEVQFELLTDIRQ
jgi:hypothetical protein